MAIDRRAGDLLDRIRAELDQRLAELRAHVEEHQQLLEASQSLQLDPGSQALPTRGRGGSAAKPVRKPRTAGRASTVAKPAGTAAAELSPKVGSKSAAKGRGRAPKPKPKPAATPRGPQGVTQQAIAAALEHGSHTLAELVLVTAIPAATLRAQLSPLQKMGAVSKVRREGKAAYMLLRATSAASSGPKKGAKAK